MRVRRRADQHARGGRAGEVRGASVSRLRPRSTPPPDARGRLFGRSESHVDGHRGYASSMEAAAPRYCYRHPDRETGLSCSECGRPDLLRVHDPRAGRAPLPGALRASRRAYGKVATAAAPGDDHGVGARRVERRDDGADRHQRRSSTSPSSRPAATADGTGQLDLRPRRRSFAKAGLRERRPGRSVRARRLVAADHGGVPPLRADPPGAEHDRLYFAGRSSSR